MEPLYLTVGLYEDGRVGELFFHGRMGELAHGLADACALVASLALQRGVPLVDITTKWRGMRFAPAGFTGDKEFPRASSILDYAAKWLESRFVYRDEVQG